MPDLAYDPTTVLGQARLHAADTQQNPNYTFSDVEFTYFLSIGQQNPMLAASYALDALATDQARIAIVYKATGTEIDFDEISQTLAQRAEDLRLQAGAMPSVEHVPRIFTIHDHRHGCGSMDRW